MIFKKSIAPLWIFFTVLIIFGMLLLYGLTVNYIWLGCALLFSVILFYSCWKTLQLINKELDQFAEAVKYHDFTRYYSTKGVAAYLKSVYKNFNEINAVICDIRAEKELQLIYIKSMIDLVDTGILSYELENGEVKWFNPALKVLLDVPYLKSIQSLEKRNADVYELVKEIRTGQQKVITIQKNYSAIKLQVSTVVFEQGGKQHKLIAFQNISKALSDEEVEIWKKLLRVMTHEIMNSVTPISSLAELLKKKMTIQEKNDNWLKDVNESVDIIQQRSQNLIRFTETYRHLNKTSKLATTRFLVSDLFEHVCGLMQPAFDQAKLDLEIILPDPYLTIVADRALIEQVVINLILNALDAVKLTEAPLIQLVAQEEVGQGVEIIVKDNGVGISPRELDSIFIPFYTSKANGSGVGLSLCRHIMVLHGGQITVISQVAIGSEFKLLFNVDKAANL